MTTRTAAAPSATFQLTCCLGALLLCPMSAGAASAPAAVRAAVERGETTQVVVELDTAATDQAADADRSRRHLVREDRAILQMKAQGYASTRAALAAAVAGGDAAQIRDFTHLPLAVWQISSVNALTRLQSDKRVLRLHPVRTYHTVSVSDLSFISQPQTAAEGATGSGTTIAVIDGGLGTNYQSYSDFGTCTAIATPASTCRVVYDEEFYPNQSTVTAHGTNVSAIALGVAASAKLAMFDIFKGSSASSTDILTAMDHAIGLQSTYNIVAINMSLGDSSSNASQCGNTDIATAVSNASKVGITTVVAAGNSGSKTGLANPACTPGVVSVGAVYDASYGTVGWNLSGGGTCTDTTAADQVTCFSQSASYLSLLAPGSFVSAPSSAFQESGTSQATPHVAGSIAVLRAKYPAETLSQTLQRLTLTGVQDKDSGNGITLSRINLLAATNQGTSVTLSGTGPTTATSGSTSTYTITITNNGPLAATNVKLFDELPGLASYISSSSGCTEANQQVICAIGTLAAGASITITITVSWTGSGSVFDTASLSSDQVDNASGASQVLNFGAPTIIDAPLPLWADALLGAGLLALMGAVTRGRFSAAALPRHS